MVLAAAEIAVEAKTKVVVDACGRGRGCGCDHGLWPWARLYPGVASEIVAKTTTTFSRGRSCSWPQWRSRAEAMANAEAKVVTEVAAVVSVFSVAVLCY